MTNRWIKICAWLLVCILELSAFAAAEKLQVVCSMFPQYDFCSNILGPDNDSVALTMLMDSGVDLHNYQPSAKDMAAVAACDLLICVGGESDAWVDSMLRAVHRQDMPVIRMINCVQIKHDVPVEGMQHHEHDYEETMDEHVWLSLRNAVLVCEKITEALCTLDVHNAAAYQNNSAAYIQRLKTLDQRYEAMVQSAVRDTVLVADRFPFRYLADDYGLHYHAAFSGCSAESEASFETVAFLIKEARELTLDTILVTESSDGQLAATIAAGSGRNPKTLVMNAIQTVSREDVETGVSYLSLMEENLNVLRIALDAPEEVEP